MVAVRLAAVMTRESVRMDMVTVAKCGEWEWGRTHITTHRMARTYHEQSGNQVRGTGNRASRSGRSRSLACRLGMTKACHSERSEAVVIPSVARTRDPPGRGPLFPVPRSLRPRRRFPTESASVSATATATD
jgi:hypothetical protein